MIDIWPVDLRATTSPRSWRDAASKALHRVLGTHLSVDPSEVRLGRDRWGKPYLVSPGRLHFNLSHTGPVALIAVSSFSPVGVDVERWTRLRDAGRLLQRISPVDDHYSPSEPQALQRCVARTWSRKEAVVKALGMGLRLPMRDITLIPRTATLAEWATSDGDQGLVLDLPTIRHHVAALAYSGESEHAMRLHPVSREPGHGDVGRRDGPDAGMSTL